MSRTKSNLGYTVLVLFLSAWGFGQSEINSNKDLIIQQLRYSHDQENWFAPIQKAVEGLSAEQARWKDSTENHSIAQLVSHLIFWNGRVLQSFEGIEVSEFKEENEVTFNTYTEHEWNEAIKTLDSIQNRWIVVIQQAPEAHLNKWESTLLNISTHNAYHTGQIIYIRKQKGWWN